MPFSRPAKKKVKKRIIKFESLLAIEQPKPYSIIEPDEFIEKAEKPEPDPKDLKDIKSQLQIVQQSESSSIVVLAINIDSNKNSISRIPCTRGITLDGYSYIYDATRDTYFAECADYLMLGYIDVSFKMNFKEGLDLWNVDVPMPESVIKRHLTSSQKKDLKMFKDAYKEHKFNFLQLTSFC